ncbi:MAG: MerR family transcriptional regulator [Bacillota bacterium]|nr:MerR family transcriptional regulator [Bacillota bacterium]
MPYLRNQIAKLANISVETLRYYEKFGLMPIPKRNESGYRIYDDDTLKRLEVIGYAKACGLTLEEIRELLPIIYDSNINYDNVIEIIDNKINVINEKINELNRMVQILNTMKANINNSVNCPLKSSFKNL